MTQEVVAAMLVQVNALAELLKVELCSQVAEHARISDNSAGLATLFDSYEASWRKLRHEGKLDAADADKLIELAATALRLVLDLVPGEEKARLFKVVQGGASG